MERRAHLKRADIHRDNISVIIDTHSMQLMADERSELMSVRYTKNVGQDAKGLS